MCGRERTPDNMIFEVAQAHDPVAAVFVVHASNLEMIQQVDNYLNGKEPQLKGERRSRKQQAKCASPQSCTCETFERIAFLITADSNRSCLLIVMKLITHLRSLPQLRLAEVLPVDRTAGRVLQPAADAVATVQMITG